MAKQIVAGKAAQQFGIDAMSSQIDEWHPQIIGHGAQQRCLGNPFPFDNCSQRSIPFVSQLIQLRRRHQPMS